MPKCLNSFLYTKGKYVRKGHVIVDKENDCLYALGKYPTNITKENLTDDFIEFKSGTIWYLTGYIKTSGIKDIYYKPRRNNHLFKDDYIYISYNGDIKVNISQNGHEEICGYDILVCGNSIFRILLAAEKYSGTNISKIRMQVEEKKNWFKENHKNDYEKEYLQAFGVKDVDLFELYK